LDRCSQPDFSYQTFFRLQSFQKTGVEHLEATILNPRFADGFFIRDFFAFYKEILLSKTTEITALDQKLNAES